MSDRYLTPRMYARRYNFTLSGVYAKLAANRLPATQRDGRWFIDSARLDDAGRPHRARKGMRHDAS